MAVAEQIAAHQALDIDGYILRGQLYVPAGAVQSFRGMEGVDESHDSAGNHYAALAVAPHAPANTAINGTFYASGTAAGSYNLSLGAPGAGLMQYLRGFVVSSQVSSSGSQQVHFGFSGITGLGDAWWQYVTITQGALLALNFPDPIAASASNTAIVMTTTFTALTTFRWDVMMWGFNRAV